MTSISSKSFDRFLMAFIVAGALLVTLSWAVTGKQSVAAGLLPFVMLYVIQFGAQSRKSGCDCESER